MKATHVFAEGESVCSVEGCECKGFHLWEVFLQDPFGDRHMVSNITKFVRDNPDLFDSEDCVVRGLPCGETFTRADRGLMKIAERHCEAWKE